MSPKQQYQELVRESGSSISEEARDVDLEPEVTQADITQGKDVAMSKKMFLVNNALDQIGFTWFHVKLFCIAGFGYSAD